LRREEGGDLLAFWLLPRRWCAEDEVSETEREQEVYENSGPLQRVADDVERLDDGDEEPGDRGEEAADEDCAKCWARRDFAGEPEYGSKADQGRSKVARIRARWINGDPIQ